MNQLKKLDGLKGFIVIAQVFQGIHSQSTDSVSCSLKGQWVLDKFEGFKINGAKRNELEWNQWFSFLADGERN